MAEGLFSASSNGRVYITQDAVTLDNTAIDTSEAINSDDYNHISIIAWGSLSNITVAIEVSHDGTTFKELYKSSAVNPIVYQMILNAKFIRIKVTNSSGGAAQSVNAHIRLSNI